MRLLNFLNIVLSIAYASGYANIQKTLYVGSDGTLEGTQSQAKVAWYFYRTNTDPVKLCKGELPRTHKTPLTFSCSNNNLTLFSITKQYTGTYYSTNFHTGQDKYYTVKVENPTTPRTTTTTTTAKPTVKTTTRTTTTTETTTSTTLAATTHTHTKLTLQTTNDLIALLQKGDNSTTSNEEIPKSMIGIIVAVVVCMLIIALCMVYYAFCYRKHRLNDKLEHLLSVEF
ncbi:E3 25.4 kDa [Simian adenovirus 23]|uniref:E3 25.4 kDa n=1 Tax=Simian adenovirus 23 TaxID=35266 RepID=Q6QPD1_9ADEN|nr:E3 25.4 kDa [Simian adenovirus 23]